MIESLGQDNVGEMWKYGQTEMAATLLGVNGECMKRETISYRQKYGIAVMKALKQVKE